MNQDDDTETLDSARRLMSSDTYRGDELRPYQGRPGAMRAFELPSRMGERLYYRCGRVEKVEQ